MFRVRSTEMNIHAKYSNKEGILKQNQSWVCDTDTHGSAPDRQPRLSQKAGPWRHSYAHCQDDLFLAMHTSFTFVLTALNCRKPLVASASVNNQPPMWHTAVPDCSLFLVNSDSPCKVWCEGQPLLYHPTGGGSHANMKRSSQSKTPHSTHRTKQQEGPAPLRDQPHRLGAGSPQAVLDFFNLPNTFKTKLHPPSRRLSSPTSTHIHAEENKQPHFAKCLSQINTKN